ncbi:unnamed protein product, partial [marine sediment metagenome]
MAFGGAVFSGDSKLFTLYHLLFDMHQLRLLDLVLRPQVHLLSCKNPQHVHHQMY